MELEKLISEHKIIAILRNVPPEKVESYIKAVYDGGIRLIEIALNTPDALDQIKLARRLYDGKLTVGAGTVITIQLAQEAMDAGAQFLLSPCTNAEVLQYCRKNAIDILPGVMTPGDVDTCLKYGVKTLKLFPAGDLPKNYIKSLSGPFSDASYVAVGGVGPDNIKEFFDRGFVGAGIGSNLIPQKFIDENRWDEARTFVADLVERTK